MTAITQPEIDQQVFNLYDGTATGASTAASS
jgi:hypothetical protein